MFAPLNLVPSTAVRRAVQLHGEDSLVRPVYASATCVCMCVLLVRMHKFSIMACCTRQEAGVYILQLLLTAMNECAA